MFTEFIKFSTKTEDVLMFREEEGADLKLIHKFILVGGWFLNRLLLTTTPQKQSEIRDGAWHPLFPAATCGPCKVNELRTRVAWDHLQNISRSETLPRRKLIGKH